MAGFPVAMARRACCSPYKCSPFLYNCESLLLMYLASSSLAMMRPPNAMTFPERLRMGNINRPRKRSYALPRSLLPSSAASTPIDSLNPAAAALPRATASPAAPAKPEEFRHLSEIPLRAM